LSLWFSDQWVQMQLTAFLREVACVRNALNNSLHFTLPDSPQSYSHNTQRSITISMSENSNSVTNYLQTRCIIQQELTYNTTVPFQTLSQTQTHFQLIIKLVQAYTGINQVTLTNSNSIIFILITNSLSSHARSHQNRWYIRWQWYMQLNANDNHIII